MRCASIMSAPRCECHAEGTCDSHPRGRVKGRTADVSRLNSSRWPASILHLGSRAGLMYDLPTKGKMYAPWAS